MTRFPLIALAAIFIANTALSDSTDPPLFVTQSGSDLGDCQSSSSPCETISYALRRVGKNGQIRVGEGSFELTDAADVIYLLSGAIDVRGGYDTGTISTLVGVPPEFAQDLEAKGFRVIADSKGAGQAIVKSQLALRSNAAATDCVGGLAGAFPCSNVNLLSQVSDRVPATRGADIWGFMDLNTHREYVIMGYGNGTAVFDVNDAENPREVGFISGQATIWRDIKVYQFWNASAARWNAYAYITTDGASDGLFIIDLSQLPHSISRVSYASDFAQAHNVYLTDTDFSTGLSITGDVPSLILAGSTISDGRFRAYSLANPAAPSSPVTPATPSGQPGSDRLYMHDAASMIISDTRKDTQCINAATSDHCDVLLDFNESTLDIWDVTNRASPARISRTPYTNAAYTHSGWSSEDKQFVFVQDETDERDRGLNTTLRVFSVADLAAPTLAGTWVGPTNAIDHNGFVRGNRYYMSNYARGLTILDISTGSSPTLVGRFDTYPASDTVGFPGNWGAYPFLPSGYIALSDIDSGLYLVEDDTLDVVEGTLSFTTDSFGADETQTVDLRVQRAAGAQGAISVSWEAISASASFNDITNRSGTLNWADGDASDRTISLGLVDDGVDENLERVIIKLTAPTGGATLSSPSMASAYIADPADGIVVDFANASIDVSERGFASAIAVSRRSGNASGAVSVDYSITAGDAIASVDYTGPATGTLTWADGDATPKSIEYAIIDDGSAEPGEFFTISLSNLSTGSLGTNAALTVNIVDGDGMNNAPNSIAGSSRTVNIGNLVTLNGGGSNDPDGDSLTYAWTQSLGPTVALTNAATASATFTAPSVMSDTLFRFDLLVTDPSGLSDTSTVNITVSATTNVNGVGGGGGGGAIGAWLLLGLLGICGLIRRDAFLRSSALDQARLI